MKEYKVGEQIILEVKGNAEGECKGCFFTRMGLLSGCHTLCNEDYRSDHKNVIFVEKKVT